MARQLTQYVLERETEAFRGSGGISQENRGFGFVPAFFDAHSSTVYPSRFADGRPAPFHLIDGLPDEAVAERDAAGRAILLRNSIVSGFVRNGCFYTGKKPRPAPARATDRPIPPHAPSAWCDPGPPVSDRKAHHAGRPGSCADSAPI